MSNSTNTNTNTDTEYHCTLENSCATFISIGTFFSLLFLCSCGAMLYRYRSVCLAGFQEDVFEISPTERVEQSQENKAYTIQNPITIVCDEDPC